MEKKVEKKCKIIIADPNVDYRNSLREWIRDQPDLEIIAETGDGANLIPHIINHQPDLVVMALNLGSVDGLEVLEQMSTRTFMVRPRILVVSKFLPDGMTEMVADLGVDYFMSKPCHPSKICQRIRQLIGISVSSVDLPLNLEIQVSKILMDMGMPAHINGYQYLRFAIIESVKNPDLLQGVTKSLYPMIAKSFRSTPPRVERSIRHAIDTAWERGEDPVHIDYFGHTISDRRGRPTNSEFIAMLSDKLRMEYQIG